MIENRKEKGSVAEYLVQSIYNIFNINNLILLFFFLFLPFRNTELLIIANLGTTSEIYNRSVNRHDYLKNYLKKPLKKLSQPLLHSFPIYIYIYIYIYIKLAECCQGRPRGSLFSNYYSEV